MQTEFVRFHTEDGVILHGMLFSPDDKTDRCVLHVHGLAGNFYENDFIRDMASCYARSGYAFLSFNNRGHDYICDVAVDPRFGKEGFKGGGAYERFAESLEDISAALQFLRSRGFQGCVLQGHSSGCNKIVYSLSKRNLEVQCQILISPCDDIGIMESFLKENFKAGLQQARNLVAEDKGTQLIDEDKTFYPMSAQTYLDYYEEGSLQDVFPYRKPDSEFGAWGALDQKTLVLFGEEKDYLNDSVDRTFEILKTKASSKMDLVCYAVPGADHGYAGQGEVLASTITQWLCG